MDKAVIYARVSSKEQEREGYSIPAQLKFLNEYAVTHSFNVVKEFVDNETAKKSGRTNFGEMIKYLRKHTTSKNNTCRKDRQIIP
jgi:site-specific DNA recombinase